MAGRTVVAGYERDDGTFGSVRVASTTITTWNPVAVGTRSGYFIKARGSKREYGTVARSVSLSRPVGDGTAYSGGTVNLTIPVFQKTVWAALATGQVLAYQGKTDWSVSGTNSEESK